MMKKVLFDLNHPVDVNFFKNTVISLINSNIKVDIIYRDRGKLKDILKYEMPIDPVLKGKHFNSFFKKIFGQLSRDFNLYFFLLKRKYEVVICFGPTSAISSWFSRTPYLAFDDDFEYKIPFYHANLFATKHIYPDFIGYSNKKVIKYHGYKELAYLHPNYFKPQLIEIHKLGILENKYVFIRHISSVSLNYKDTKDTLAELISLLKSLNIKVLLSIEDKTLVNQIDPEIVVLKEPLPDIYSLMYYALLAISYGDTVARECSLLGVPTVYLGGRNMMMHEELIQEGIMTSTQDLADINAILSSDLLEKKIKCKNIVAEKIKTQWCDTTMVILDQISVYIK
jgi:predicted glycosyltransferase